MRTSSLWAPRSRLLAVVLAALAATDGRAAGAAFAPDDLRALREVVTLEGGRMKPFATLAREAVQHVFGARRYEGEDPVATYAGIIVDVAPWLGRKCLVPDRAARAVFSADVLSPAEVIEFWESRIAALHRMQNDAETSPAAFEQERAKLQTLWDAIGPLYGRAEALKTAAAGLRFLPDPNGAEGEWLTEEEARAAVERGVAALTPGLDAYRAIKKAYAEKNGAALVAASGALKSAQRTLAGQCGAPMLSERIVRLENLYYSVDFRAVGLAWFSLATVIFVLAGAKRCAVCGYAAAAAYVLGVVWNAWIIAGHTAIAERLPLKNLHEVYLVVLFFVPLIGVVLRCSFGETLYLGVAAALTALGFVGSLFLPAEGYVIGPLVAILHSPWREVHILTIMLSYAIFLVACGLHAAFLVAALRSPYGPDGTRAYSPLADGLHRNAVLTVGWGFFFLTVGIATGAAWANSSWGRYWGWDPKEVWATVAWLIYAALLHLRVFFRTRREVLAALNLLGFAAIIFTYFGVTYLLSGLHAYR